MFEFVAVKGKILIAQSRKDKKEERLKAFFLSQRASRKSLKQKRFITKGCLNKLFINLVWISFVHWHSNNFIGSDWKIYDRHQWCTDPQGRCDNDMQYVDVAMGRSVILVIGDQWTPNTRVSAHCDYDLRYANEKGGPDGNYKPDCIIFEIQKFGFSMYFLCKWVFAHLTTRWFNCDIAMDGRAKRDYRTDFIYFKVWEFEISLYSHILRLLDLSPKR